MRGLLWLIMSSVSHAGETIEVVATEAKENREFEECKADTQKEFIEYKREFGLEANRMADRPLGGETKKDMESLETYAEEWLKEVRD
jgi:hypothetical protein